MAPALCSTFARLLQNIRTWCSHTRFVHQGFASKDNVSEQLNARIIPKMEQFSEQLNQALTSFVTASKSELEQLKQNLVELNQKCTELEESNEKLTLNDTEQRDLLIRLVREQEGTRERFSSIERTIEKQQRATKEQSRTISLLQAENASLKMALSRSPVVAPNQPLPSRESKTTPQPLIMLLY